MFLTKSKEESYIMQERKDIERQKSNKDSLIETSDERSMERQVNRILKLTNLKETLRKKLEKERGMIRKEKEDDSLINKGWKNDSFKKSDSLKEKIDERLKSIERSMIYTQNVNNMDILRNNVMDIIKLLNKSVNVHQNEIDQVKKKTELKSTNPLKVNKRKRKKIRHNNEIDRKSTQSPER